MKHHRVAVGAALLALAIAFPALAQNVPRNTVQGRLGIPPGGGPVQAIPFSVLAGQLRSPDATDPSSFGAICDGVAHQLSTRFTTMADAQDVYPAAVALTDYIDWAAIQTMLNAGRAIVQKDATCVLNRKLNLVDAKISIRGAGVERTVWIWPSNATSAGIQANQSNQLQSVTIQNITLASGEDAVLAAPTHTAITVSRSAADATWVFPAVTLRDVSMRGQFLASGFPTNGWRRGFDGVDLMYLIADNVSYTGVQGPGSSLRASLVNGTDYAFRITTTGARVSCCARFSNINVEWADTAIYHGAGFESLEIRNSDLFNVNNGIVVDASAAPTPPSQLIAAATHINALVRGVKATKVTYVDLQNTLIFQQTLADTATIGIELLGTPGVNVSGNSFYKGSVDPTKIYTHISVNVNGVDAFQPQGISISGNYHDNGEVGIAIGSASVTGYISGEKFSSAWTGTNYSGTLTGMMVHGIVGLGVNWNCSGAMYGVGERYALCGGGLMIDGAAVGTPLRTNQTNDGNTWAAYKANTATWIASLTGGGMQFGRTADLNGFFGATPVAKQTVSGVRYSHPALTSLLTGMASLGLITDSTTAGGTFPVSLGGTGNTVFNVNALLVGNGTSAIQDTGALATGEIVIGQASGVPLHKAVSGDISLTAAGVTAIGALKVTSAMLNADVFSTAHSWGGVQTLTSPVIATIVNTGTLTLPTSTDTLVGKATTDTFTNKTYDTAGTGNVFKVNGQQITGFSGLGNSVPLTNSPTFITPVLGVATATSITFGGSALANYVSATSWTPADGSGAGLSFTSVSASYTRIGNMVFAYGRVTYPATGSGANASISGLPITSANATYATSPCVAYSTGGSANANIVQVGVNSTSMAVLKASGAATLNSDISGVTLLFQCSYPAT